MNLEETDRTLSQLLLDVASEDGWWEGELSTSALSTSTAVMALQLACRCPQFDEPTRQRYQRLVENGLRWLSQEQNDDGGWGDTQLSISNISTTMLAHAAISAADSSGQYSDCVDAADKYIREAGGVDAVIRRYGDDHTFSVPILTHCALAGTVNWKQVPPLPFEFACVPARWYAAVRLPVVSYALPALIAIGQVIFHHRGHWNPLVRWVRRASVSRSLNVLKSIQPPHGGFLEATPLTSFVCMSLLGCGRADHSVTQRCLQFIEQSVREDGSWPIDTNLSTWVTTLSVNALTGDPHSRSLPPEQAGQPYLSDDQRQRIRAWLLAQQYRQRHPYTNSPPGGWSWTDLPGGVPDADDTPGAMLAILNLRTPDEDYTAEEKAALQQAARWLLDLQNRDGGWPTFCRGWGKLPFDRSSNDLTAHVLRALMLWQSRVTGIRDEFCYETERAIRRGFQFLQKTQRADGTWLPLWFGHQHNEEDENPLYGTAKVLLAVSDAGRLNEAFAQRSVEWLLKNQNEDGGWSARKGLPSSNEETGLAVEALASLPEARSAVEAGLRWIASQVDNASVAEPSPIGFYFAKLWYFEQLYPVIFTTAAVRRCLQHARRTTSSE